MELKYEPFHEALKLLKEWSTALVVIQTGAMAVLGGLVKDGVKPDAFPWLVTSLICFILSILVAAHVIGAMPPIMQKLPEKVEQYGDIYKMQNYLHIPIGILAFSEHILFMAGLVSFGFFVFYQAGDTGGATHRLNLIGVPLFFTPESCANLSQKGILHMNITRIILGYSVSTIVGAFVIWLLMEKILWPLIIRKHNIEGKKPFSLTILLGILERASYTTAFVFQLPAWIGIYLAMKVAVGWHGHQLRKSPSENLYLIGNLLSILFGLFGAWIVLGKFCIN
jgi:hypothetical protein